MLVLLVAIAVILVGVLIREDLAAADGRQPAGVARSAVSAPESSLPVGDTEVGSRLEVQRVAPSGTERLTVRSSSGALLVGAAVFAVITGVHRNFVDEQMRLVGTTDEHGAVNVQWHEAGLLVTATAHGALLLSEKVDTAVLPLLREIRVQCRTVSGHPVAGATVLCSMAGLPGVRPGQGAIVPAGVPGDWRHAIFGATSDEAGVAVLSVPDGVSSVQGTARGLGCVSGPHRLELPGASAIELVFSRAIGVLAKIEDDDLITYSAMPRVKSLRGMPGSTVGDLSAYLEKRFPRDQGYLCFAAWAASDELEGVVNFRIWGREANGATQRVAVDWLDLDDPRVTPIAVESSGSLAVDVEFSLLSPRGLALTDMPPLEIQSWPPAQDPTAWFRITTDDGTTYRLHPGSYRLVGVRELKGVISHGFEVKAGAQQRVEALLDYDVRPLAWNVTSSGEVVNQVFVRVSSAPAAALPVERREVMLNPGQVWLPVGAYSVEIHPQGFAAEPLQLPEIPAQRLDLSF
ncbi:MAG: hypothetical protein R3F29_04665 [Planctomycetota bacterium]